MDITKLETWLKEMGLKDDGQEIDIDYNGFKCGYVTAAVDEARRLRSHPNWERDWVTEVECQAAMEKNQIWSARKSSGHNNANYLTARACTAHAATAHVFGEMGEEMIAQLTFIQSMFDKLMVGEHTMASFGFSTGQWFSQQKDKQGPYIEQKATLKQWDEEEAQYHGSDDDEYVSTESREKAYEQNLAWYVNWYPHTPIGSYTARAATLQELVDLLEQEKPELT